MTGAEIGLAVMGVVLPLIGYRLGVERGLEAERRVSRLQRRRAELAEAALFVADGATPTLHAVPDLQPLAVVVHLPVSRQGAQQ